jgi:2,3-bisphosphoglycerate-independent phosphoglycerate mutase
VIRDQGEPEVTIADGDCVLFMNFRADRARQLTHAFIDADFDEFPRNTLPALSDFVMTTEYSAAIQTSCAYPPTVLSNVLPEYLANLGKTQLRIAETEKYAHVTFFFSGGREEPFEGEDRVLVPSPDVATYDLQPEMSAHEVTDKLVAAIESGSYDLIVCNYANGDMVGHTGNFAATVKAVETLDHCLGRLQQALAEYGGEALVTADHGNCEQMLDYQSGQHHTQHTTELVPLVYIGHRQARLRENGGVLADVAPTLLQLMNLPKPAEMSGNGLLEFS